MWGTLPLLLDRLETTLSGVSELSGWAIHRDDYVPIQEDALPAVAIVLTGDSQDDDDYADNGAETRIAQIQLDFRTVGHPVSATLLPVIRPAIAAILSDRRQGGLVMTSTARSMTLAGEKADKDYAGAGVLLEFTYRNRP